jgi:predicted  nucleic acid-binding Zn-ribbon protein
MHTNHAPDSQFRELLHAVALLSEGQRILVLRKELRRTLERAEHLERQGRDLERELRQLRRELARRKAGARHQRREMRIEMLATEARCWALEEVCRALVLTIEQAACSEVEGPPLAVGVSP